MTDTIIHRPRCHHAIPLTEALSTQLRKPMEASLRAEKRRIEEQACTQAEAIRSELEAQLHAEEQKRIQTAFAHAASQGKNEKMEQLYHYLAGDQFRQKVQGIVEGFTALQDQLARERRAMEKLRKEREKQIERVITNTVGIYGEMSGILGASMPEIPALTLEAGLLESDEG